MHWQKREFAESDAIRLCKSHLHFLGRDHLCSLCRNYLLSLYLSLIHIFLDELVTAYNSNNQTAFSLLPAGNYTLPVSWSITKADGTDKEFSVAISPKDLSLIHISDMDDAVKDATETEEFLYTCYANVTNPITYTNIEFSTDEFAPESPADDFGLQASSIILFRANHIGRVSGLPRPSAKAECRWP